MLVLAAFLAALVFGPAPTASAVEVHTESGSRGVLKVTVTTSGRPVMVDGELESAGGWLFQHFRTSGLTVFASPAATGAQTVKVAYLLQRRPLGDTAWLTPQTVEMSSKPVSGAQYASFGSHIFHQLAVDRADYRVVYRVEWVKLVDGEERTLGVAYVLPELENTRCSQVASICTAKDGWITI